THPAIDPPIMPTLIPVTPDPLGVPPQEVMAVRQFNGVHSRIGLRGTGQALPVPALGAVTARLAGRRPGEADEAGPEPRLPRLRRAGAHRLAGQGADRLQVPHPTESA